MLVNVLCAAVIVAAGVSLWRRYLAGEEDNKPREPLHKTVQVYVAIGAGLVAFLNGITPDDPVFRDVSYNAKANTITGHVRHVANPEEYRVLLFLETAAGWELIPQSAREDKGQLQKAAASSSFTVNAYREGFREQDSRAAKYTVFLIASEDEGDELLADYDAVNRLSVHLYTAPVPERPDDWESGNEAMVEEYEQGQEDRWDEEEPGVPQPFFEDVVYDREEKMVRGRVSGLRPEDVAAYRVVFFIHTNSWYIKPEFSERALVALDVDGGFAIAAYRRYPGELTDEVTGYAVLLVAADYEGPSRQTAYGAVQEAAVICWEELYD